MDTDNDSARDMLDSSLDSSDDSEGLVSRSCRCPPPSCLPVVAAADSVASIAHTEGGEKFFGKSLSRELVVPISSARMHAVGGKLPTMLFDNSVRQSTPNGVSGDVS